MDGSRESPGQSRLRLCCLGHAEIALDGRAFVLSAGRKGLALLCVLAAEPERRIGRERLAALLWGGRFEEQARQSLRQTLSALRRDLEPVAPGFVEVDREFIGLGALATDLDEFETALTRNDASSAAALWRGEFAEGIEIDSDGWSAWRSEVRARLRPAMLGVFENLARSAANDTERLAAAERMLTLDPFNEVAIRLVLPPLARIHGAAAAALRYNSFVERLQQEKERQPLPETAAVHAAIVGAPAGMAATAAPPKGISRRALAACFGAVALFALGVTAWSTRGGNDGERAEPVATTFIEPSQLRWPFRFGVAEPRALDREPATLKAVETLAEDIRNALGVMPGSALAATPAQTDFTIEAVRRFGMPRGEKRRRVSGKQGSGSSEFPPPTISVVEDLVCSGLTVVERALGVVAEPRRAVGGCHA